MKIVIGSIFKAYEKSGEALELPGIGVKEAVEDKDGFLNVELSREEMIILRDEIDRELLDEEAANFQ